MAGGEQLIPQFQKSLEEYTSTYMAARNLAARSRKEYATDVAQFLAYLQQAGVRKLASVGPPHIEGFLAKLDQRRLAGVTRQRKLTVLRTFLGWLRSNGQIAANPASAAGGSTERRARRAGEALAASSDRRRW